MVAPMVLPCVSIGFPYTDWKLPSGRPEPLQCNRFRRRTLPDEQCAAVGDGIGRKPRRHLLPAGHLPVRRVADLPGGPRTGRRIPGFERHHPWHRVSRRPPVRRGCRHRYRKGGRNPRHGSRRRRRDPRRPEPGCHRPELRETRTVTTRFIRWAAYGQSAVRHLRRSAEHHRRYHDQKSGTATVRTERATGKRLPHHRDSSRVRRVLRLAGQTNASGRPQRRHGNRIRAHRLRIGGQPDDTGNAQDRPHQRRRRHRHALRGAHPTTATHSTVA